MAHDIEAHSKHKEPHNRTAGPGPWFQKIHSSLSSLASSSKTTDQQSSSCSCFSAAHLCRPTWTTGETDKARPGRTKGADRLYFRLLVFSTRVVKGSWLCAHSIRSRSALQAVPSLCFRERRPWRGSWASQVWQAVIYAAW